ncbi:hypothetical protein [Corynebacterium guangdongense]|uniref:Host cell surface-exposed lipoprotein n=1 Tax=Corynebacterium guangdongense TaxID=1783348 RepID=A0ABU1ZZ52_9CORY|nr:hypothetical protein [Corynebacterium guangdongense]MDR7330201.1 hypothetical protein [Corynebacterium guangdongense]WJZ18759.1 hypothetical protein CGUA_11070 [Corynebacterium guangdongense]
MSSPHDDRQGRTPFAYTYPPADTFLHGYDNAYRVGDPALAGGRSLRGSLIIAAVGILAIIAVLVAFLWFLSERSASTSGLAPTPPSVTSVPSPWGDAEGAPNVIQAPQLAPVEEASTDVDAARSEAEALLSHAGFSRVALIGVLTTKEVGQSFYTEAAATEAVDSLGVNWVEQAQRSGQELIEGEMGFSPSSLYEFLVGEEMGGFTPEEATAGVRDIRVDWSDEAVKAARFNLAEGLSTPDTLLQDLLEEGFTREQANEAVTEVVGETRQRAV